MANSRKPTHDMVQRHAWQTIGSLLTTASVVGLNLHLGWASPAAIIPSGYALLSYNVLDTIVGWPYYVSFDRTMLAHHVGAVAGIGTLLHACVAGGYVADLQRFVAWVLLAEVTTFFNCIRLLTRHTAWRHTTESIFGLVFLVGRAAMTVGCTLALYSNTLFTTLAPITFFTGAFNLHWCAQILRLAQGLDPKASTGRDVRSIGRYIGLALTIALIHQCSPKKMIPASDAL